jgi:hypothetical protein
MNRHLHTIQKKEDIQMSKKNTAVASKLNYSITEIEGKKVFALSASFKSTLVRDATTIGEAVHNMRAAAAGKAELALNITEAFDVWKDKIGGSGLPEFVHLFVDTTCPDKYGKVGSEQRRQITTNKVFTGIEAMVKNARSALKIRAERQKLIASGKDPDSAGDTRDYNKDVRDAKAAAFTKAFTRSIVSFDKFGITETTISNFLILVLKKKEKENDELNKQGQDLRDAAIKALFISRGMKIEEKEPKPSDTPELMETLKKAAKTAKSKK